jgi:hypothetical protein
MLTKRQVLARWKKLAGDRSPGAWKDEEDVSGLLEQFRPGGEGIEAVFEGIERGDEVCARLREVYQATERGGVGLYFIPVPAVTPERAEVEALLHGHVGRLREMAAALEDAEAMAVLETMPEVEWVEGELPQDEEGKEWEAYLVDVRIDFTIDTIKAVRSHALLLEEALYMATTSPAVRDYVLWPLYRDSSPVEEPFGPEFELWKRGIEWAFRRPGTIAVRISTPPEAAVPDQESRPAGPVPYPAAQVIAKIEQGKPGLDEAYFRRRIEEELGAQRILLGTLCSAMSGMGLAAGEAATLEILRGDPSAWAGMGRALRYIGWEYRIRTACKEDQLQRKQQENEHAVFRVEEDTATSALVLAIALGQDALAGFCGSRLIRNFTRGDLLSKELDWKGSPGGPFAALLYARWRGREADLRKKPVRGFFESLAKDREHFRIMAEEWDSDTRFLEAFKTACDAFCEDAREGYGTRLFRIFPAELLALARVRRDLGRQDPAAHHPLFESPVTQVPQPLPAGMKDDLFERAVAACRAAYPHLSLEYPW